MKILIPLTMLFFLTMGLSSCSKVKIQSYPANSIVQIDGSAADWENVPLVFNEKPAVVFGAVNDTGKLDLMMRFNDPALAQMMFRRGFKIWFDKDKKFGLNFLGRTPPRMPEGRRLMVNDSLRSRRFQKMGFPASLSLRDFDVVIKGAVRNIYQVDIPLLNAAYGVEGGLFCFEFSVPLVKEKEKGYGAVVSKKGNVDIQFVINEIKRPQKGGNVSAMRGGGMASGRRGGGGGRRGGGLKGGGMTRPDMSAMEVKATVQLASFKDR